MMLSRQAMTPSRCLPGQTSAWKCRRALMLQAGSRPMHTIGLGGGDLLSPVSLPFVSDYTWLCSMRSSADGCLTESRAPQQASAEEIEAQLGGRELTAVVFFLDETFEEVAYGMATTVADAVAQLAGLIRLTNFETFTLFESRKVRLCLRLLE